MNEFGISPLSGLPLTQATTHVEGIPFFVGERCGPWATTLKFDIEPLDPRPRPIRKDAPYAIGELDLTLSQVEKLKALALSMAFQAKCRGQFFPLFISQLDKQVFEDGLRPIPYNFRLITIEDVWRDAERLTLTDKANETLLNLADSEPAFGTEFMLPVKYDPGAGMSEREEPDLDADHSDQSGMRSLRGLVYGAPKGERGVVLGSLADEGFVNFFGSLNFKDQNGAQNNGQLAKITPAGYRHIEALRSGDGSQTRTAFLICPCASPHRKFFDKVCQAVSEHADVQCPILPVWATHHVDVITDRIFQSIRQATIVVVDLDTSNFNVALEAGYALALGKPIVWTRKEPWAPDNPFDIYSHMILKWSEDHPGKFEEELRGQVIAALDKAKGGA